MSSKKQVINDYRYQREVIEGTNHERMLKRRAEREKNNRQLKTKLNKAAPDTLYVM
jgi:hypothetical protein